MRLPRPTPQSPVSNQAQGGVADCVPIAAAAEKSEHIEEDLHGGGGECTGISNNGP